MELTKEQMAAVQTQIPAIGLIVAYYKRFGEDALKVAEEYSTQFGKVMGNNIKSSLKVTGTDANAVAAVLDAFLTQEAVMPGICRVEGNQVITETQGFCLIMEAVKMLNAPWDKIDVCYSWPVFWGVALAVNPNTKIQVVETRNRGDKRCRHVFTVT